MVKASSWHLLSHRSGRVAALVAMVVAFGWLPHLAALTCANFAGLSIVRHYFTGGLPSSPTPAEACAQGLSTHDRRAAWTGALVAMERGEARRAQSLAEGALARASPGERRRWLDSLLTLSSSVYGKYPTVVDFALDMASSRKLDSALGYVNVGRALEAAARQGDTSARQRRIRAYRLAISIEPDAFRNRVAAAESGFKLGLLLDEQRDPAALAAYRSAVRVDPHDESGGYAWMSAARAVEILVADGRVDEARAMLDYASGLPDLYHRRSLTALRLARLDEQGGRADLAIGRLEAATDHDADFAETQVFLAELYVRAGRKAEALERYRLVLRLDPSHPQARQAIERLAP